MPELPEVETLRRGLSTAIVARKIVGVEVIRDASLKGQSAETFIERTTGYRIDSIDRRGKFLLIRLSDPSSRTSPEISEITLCIHLKMRGQLIVLQTDAPIDKYARVHLNLVGGWSLRYNDMWGWGEIRALTSDELAVMPALQEMGPEPLDPAWTWEGLAIRLTNRKVAIKSLLLDQKTVAGVGNIYADESLFRAGILPQRPAASLKEAEIERLHEAIRHILATAADGGGTQSEEFVDLKGNPGRYIPKVYDRGGEVCNVCGTLLEKIRLGGRGTVFCSHCQV